MGIAKYFDPDVPGLRELLLQPEHARSSDDTGFCYYPGSPLNIVLYGPAGAGKSILALQMAVAAAGKPGWRALYFTKDTPAQVLEDRVKSSFGWFRESSPTAKQVPEALLLQRELKSHQDEFRKRQDRLRAAADHDRQELDEQLHTLEKAFRQKLDKHALGFADFSDAPLAGAGLDRYAMAHSVFESLSYFCPDLRPVFDALQEQFAQAAESAQGTTHHSRTKPFGEVDRQHGSGLGSGLFVVCDSLSPKALESHLRLQTRYAQTEHGSAAHRGLPEGVIYLFIMESAELPAGIEVAFPPDVEIRMGIRQDSHGVTTRTIQLLKTRFQKSLDEETPFVVLGAEESKTVAWHGEANLSAAVPVGSAWTKREQSRSFRSRPGVEIMPPLIHEAVPAQQGEEGDTGFGIKKLDELTDPPGLLGGGCTLLVTEERCGSTALSLHYLLAYPGKRNASPKESTLLINFSGDVTEILHTIWRYPALRSSVSNSTKTDEDAKNQWNELRKHLAAPVVQGESPRHRLYSIPLVNPQRGTARNAWFHIYIPDFTWVTAEEAMVRLRGLLLNKGPNGKGPKVTRLVLNRVGRIPARWPLLENQSVFISSLVAYCARWPGEMLLIDDTAVGVPGAGTFHSQWAAVAQNILRTRRIPFHGGETVALEVIKASGRTIRQWRPSELVFKPDATGFGEEIRLEDEFRGYIGLPTGRPEHCQVLVELSYDLTRTPLHREVVATKGSLEAAMDRLTVRLLSPGAWSGINSAFHNLSSVSRDTCHVVSIDGIWLKNLLEADVLHRLSDDELTHALRDHKDKQAIQNQAGSDLEKEVANHYVTRALNASIDQLEEDRKKIVDTGLRFALPMRHNWGVLAIAKPSKPFIQPVFRSLLSLLPTLAEKKRPSDGGLVWAQLAKSVGVAVCKLPQPVREPVQAVLEVLGVLDATGSDVDDRWKTIWRHIWDEQPTPHISYQELADFRTDYWHDFWRGGWVERVLTAAATKEESKRDPWLALFPRIDFFGLALTSPESVNSFFLELLLAHVGFKTLFGAAAADKVTLDFQNTTGSQLGLTDVLFLFYRLLSRNQRRRIGTAICPDVETLGARPQSRVAAADLSPRALRDWPTQICLFSREWITTVEDLLPQCDVRERIMLRPLPDGDKLVTGGYWREVGVERKCGGPTVAGTWYLGILQGGNTDLAADIMKEVLSADRERQRLLSRCGAPVSKALYLASRKDQPESLPYSRELASLHNASPPDPRGTLLPFYRERVRNYIKVSPILYELVCQVMRLAVPEKEAILRSDCPPKDRELVKLKETIRSLVKHALGEIVKMQDVSKLAQAQVAKA